MNLPNAITVLRIVLVPFFVGCLFSGHYGYALFIFVMAGISDALDGAIARMMDQKTDFGVLLDPIADKVLVLAAFISLAVLRKIPLWLAASVIIRDSIILSGSLALYRLGFGGKIKPMLIGKATTFMLLALLVVVLLGVYMGREFAFVEYLIWLTTALVIVSGVQYVIRGFQIVLGREKA
jgi:cardiolipin synthase (CMP-forming)